MARFAFTLDINVDGTQYKAGDIADEKDIPKGCLASMVRLKQVEEVKEPAKPGK